MKQSDSPTTNLTLTSDRLHFVDEVGGSPVSLALDDLRRDLSTVLGSGPADADAPTFAVRLDSGLPPETYRLDIGDAITVSGGDELGCVYGIYAFSKNHLGVDPLWFWKDLEPESRDALSLPASSQQSDPACFRHRGWFINDEDLLGHWKDPSPKRFRDWPSREKYENLEPGPGGDHYEKRLLRYYAPVMTPDVMDKVYEALLRCGGNLVIPASFIDIMNEPEADLVRGAVRRGLRVSQHHVEPLGVSHFTYETWWAKQGKTPEFSYRSHPDAMRECWRAYAKRWAELAGDQVIWQAGLRGRGDRALWDHDPEARAEAGTLVSSALADQLAIIREVDGRDHPPVTLTLWAEGTELIREGTLTVPEDVAFIFSDDWQTQRMADDFETLPREEGRDYGYYYHIAVWPLGPHLVQGPAPSKIGETAQAVADKGDTFYGILNVTNVREHAMGITAWMAHTRVPGALNETETLQAHAPAEWTPFYRDLLDAFVEPEPDWKLYDAGAWTFIHKILMHELNGTAYPYPFASLMERPGDIREQVETAKRRLDDLLDRLTNHKPDPRHRAFFQANLLTQARILRGLYGALAALLADPVRPEEAIAALQTILDAFPTAESGKWEHWYRGNLKLDFPQLITLTRKLI